jgi:uncharacterized protein YjbI with pentapeptide repeats
MVAVLVASVVAIRRGHIFGYVPLVIVPLGILIRLGYRYEWTGFKETSRPKSEKREIQPRKTLWDWMQLLFVPMMLAVLAGGLTWWQTSSERAKEAEQAARQEALRAQNTAIQAYLDQMSTLMLQTNLRTSDEDSEVRTIAQARTSAVLQAVEPENQRTLLQFLSDASLIQQGEKNPPIISLDRADLSTSDLRYIVLRGADLSFANLGDANLSFANLGDANLSSANLSGATLFRTNLSGADLRFADLRFANLSGASLSGADLNFANLSGATGVTNEELEAQTQSLEGATMPDGQKYEDWLKSKGSGEEG